MRRLLCAALLAVLPIAGHGQDAAAPEPAGKVVLVEGDVRFYDAKQVERRPALGDSIYPGERIVTGSDGEVQLTMADDGYIAVRPGTRMSIDDYKADGGADDRSVIGLLEGSFRAVTGWIGRYNRSNVRIVTPYATIGIRGTDHEPLVIPEGSKLGDPGTYDRVYAGETDLRTPQGTTRVRPNQAGFAARRGRPRPRLLARIPRFFRATRNEWRLRGLHDRIQRQIREKRLERIRRVRELRQRRGLRPQRLQRFNGERRELRRGGAGTRPLYRYRRRARPIRG